MSNMPSRSQWLRRLASRRKDRTAFVFSGGGPLGALQVGAMKALLEQGIRPDLLAGTSVGSLNAAFLAMNPTPAGVADIEALWLRFTDNDLFPGGRFRATTKMFVRGNKVYENSGIRRIIESQIGHARFEDAAVPVAVVATDIDTGAEEVFTSGPLLQPLLASTAMPGVFPPVTIGTRTFIDGGVANNVPVAPAINMGAKTLYVFDSTSHSHQRRPLQRPMDHLLHAFSLARAQRFALEQVAFAEKVRMVLIPTPPLEFFVPFASMEHTRKLIDHSYEATRSFLSGEVEVTVQRHGGGAVEAIAPAK